MRERRPARDGLRPAAPVRRPPLRWPTLLLYAAFLAYQSLGSGEGWACGATMLSLDARISRTDLLANLVAYVPLGLFGVLTAARRATRLRRVVGAACAVAIGILAFSMSVEALQSCQPDRVSSFVDVAANVAGGLSGVVLGVVLEHLALARSRAASEVLLVPSAAQRARQRLLLLTMAVALAWLASQTLPWTFSVDVGTIRANLSFLRRWPGVAALDVWRLLGHAAAWCAISAATLLVTARGASSVVALAGVSGASVAAQLLSTARAPLSFEEFLGMASAACLLAPLLLLDPPARRSASARILFAAALMTVAAYELRPEVGGVRGTFSWWPGVGLGGMRGAIDYAMLFGWCGLATVVAAASGGRSRRLLAWPIGAMAVVLALEAVQTRVPGRTGDLSAPTFTLLGILAARACLGEVDPARAADADEGGAGRRRRRDRSA